MKRLDPVDEAMRELFNEVTLLVLDVNERVPLPRVSERLRWVVDAALSMHRQLLDTNNEAWVNLPTSDIAADSCIGCLLRARYEHRHLLKPQSPEEDTPAA